MACLALAPVGVLVLAVLRWLASSADLAGAQERAEAEVARAAAQGLSLDASMVFQDPRYFLAASGPADLVTVALAASLIVFLTMVVLAGRDHELGLFRLEALFLDSRRTPFWRRLRWGAAVGAAVVGGCSLVALLLLAIVASTRGTLDGADWGLFAIIVLRTTLLGAAAGAVGVAAASLTASATTILILVAVYFPLVEIAGRAARLQHIPGDVLFDWLRSQDLSSGQTLNCGGVVCPEVFPAGDLAGTGALVAFVLVLAVVLLAGARVARRPVWS